jgi:phage terminase large subunit
MNGVQRTFEIPFTQREWQKPLIARFKAGVRHGVVIAHRRAGKDRGAMRVELRKMLTEPMECWHGLPEQEQARKVVWDVITGQGERLIDVAFPPPIRKRTINDEMKIEFVNGSLWRLVGMDRINALMGGNPKHVTYSEFALTNPKARQLIRPILAENGGSELIITTPRGYNHAWDVLQLAKANPDSWYWGYHPASQTGLISAEALADERRDMPDELYRQEYECDFSAANVGAILGSRIEAAEREGRVSEAVTWDPDMPVVLSSDIGFRDASAFWFWQPVPDGFNLIDYREESGLDADDWINLLREEYEYDYAQVWLPPDARAKTFATKRSPIERFRAAGLQVRITPSTTIAHRVNAARMMVPKCRFNPAKCARGLQVLRSWAFKWDDERRVFSSEPLHDEFSHGGDAFSYGALVMNTPEVQPKSAPLPLVAAEQFSLDQLHSDRERGEL